MTTGDPIAIIEAMKTKAAITVPRGEPCRAPPSTGSRRFERGDLLLVVDVDNAAKCEQPRIAALKSSVSAVDV